MVGHVIGKFNTFYPKVAAKVTSLSAHPLKGQHTGDLIAFLSPEKGREGDILFYAHIGHPRGKFSL